MKFSPTVFSLALVALVGTSSARAQDPANLEARIAARQELELARLDLQNYWQIEYPRLRRDLNLQIELLESEIKSNEEQQNSLRPFTRFSIGEPFPLTMAQLRLCRRAAEIRLSDLQAERNALVRFHSGQFRVLEMRVQAARQRVANLEANDVIAVTPDNSPPVQPQ